MNQKIKPRLVYTNSINEPDYDTWERMGFSKDYIDGYKRATKHIKSEIKAIQPLKEEQHFSDSVLMSMTKKVLIDFIRMLENNNNAHVVTNQIQFENAKRIINEMEKKI